MQALSIHINTDIDSFVEAGIFCVKSNTVCTVIFVRSQNRPKEATQGDVFVLRNADSVLAVRRRETVTFMEIRDSDLTKRLFLYLMLGKLARHSRQKYSKKSLINYMKILAPDTEFELYLH